MTTDAGQNELAEPRVLTDGVHKITDGFAVAHGSTMVEAYDSATVWACDSAKVEAHDSATVKAYDSATVVAHGSAKVEAYGAATVRAYDSATVEAHGSAKVDAHDCATVHTRDAWCEPTITVADQAVWIDRRKGFSVHYST